MGNKIKIGILASGRGSNLQAIIDATKKNDFPAEVVVVISNKPDAFALERAKKEKIATTIIEPNNFNNKDEYEKNILELLESYQVDLVCLAGYMKIVGKTLINKYQGRIINIHPALLPSFPGLHGQKQALDYGVGVSGCTVHFVDEGCDTGPIILQSAVLVKENDTEESLSARILEEEHKIYPAAIKLYAQGKLKINGRKVIISK